MSPARDFLLNCEGRPRHEFLSRAMAMLARIMLPVVAAQLSSDSTTGAN